MVLGLVEDLLLEVVVQLLSMLSVVSTAECVGELLAISLEVQMHSVIYQFHESTRTMHMESVSLMEHLVTTSGPMLQVYLKAITGNRTTVHAANLHTT